MAGAAIDHMFSLIVFMAAILLFIGIFNQSMGSAVVYQEHKSSATKTSDLLDAILLNPGAPLNWGQSDNEIASFGLHNPEASQYILCPFSLMRLTSTVQSPVSFAGLTYSNLTGGFGSGILTPLAQTVSYSVASERLGINGAYGFQLTLTPTVTVTLEKVSVSSTPLEFLVSVTGTGSPLAYANISYSLLLVSQEGEYPSFTVESGRLNTDETGSESINCVAVDGENESYALVVYAYLYGLRGIGYYVHVSEGYSDSAVALVESFASGTITIAHSDSLGEIPDPPPYSQLSYSASYLLLTEDYSLRQVTLDDAVGQLDNGPSSLTLPLEEGIVVIAYKGETADEHGLVLVPWGLSALAYPVTFGDSFSGYDWVATDVRQVTIGEMSYIAKLALWRLGGVAG